MIKSFACKETEKIFHGEESWKFPPTIQQRAHDRLVSINAAIRLEVLSVLPSNRLKKLHGERACQYSIRINRQWRICFVWHDGNTYDVEIVDYH